MTVALPLRQHSLTYRNRLGYLLSMNTAFNRWCESSGLTDSEIGRRLRVPRSGVAVGRWRALARYPGPDDQAAVFILTGGSVTPNDWLSDWLRLSALSDLLSSTNPVPSKSRNGGVLAVAMTVSDAG